MEQRVRMALVPYRMGSRSAPLRMGTHTPHSMPSYPPKAGNTTITLELRVELVQHLDGEADVRGMSRAAYMRKLIFDDMRRQARAQRQAARKAG